MIITVRYSSASIGWGVAMSRGPEVMCWSRYRVLPLRTPIPVTDLMHQPTDNISVTMTFPICPSHEIRSFSNSTDIVDWYPMSENMYIEYLRQEATEFQMQMWRSFTKEGKSYFQKKINLKPAITEMLIRKDWLRHIEPRTPTRAMREVSEPHLGGYQQLTG